VGCNGKWLEFRRSLNCIPQKQSNTTKDVSAGSLLSGGSAAPAHQTMGTIRHGRSQRRGGVVCDMDAILLLIALTLISWPASAWAFECIAGETLQVRSNSHRIKPGPCKVKRPLDRAAFCYSCQSEKAKRVTNHCLHRKPPSPRETLASLVAQELSKLPLVIRLASPVPREPAQTRVRPHAFASRDTRVTDPHAQPALQALSKGPLGLQHALLALQTRIPRL
jgi:hypothetical protein